LSFYSGRHAELYDLFYADKPYAAEAAFVASCLKEFQKGQTRKIVELACGTGNHAFLLEDLGYEITAIDESEDMIKLAREKASKAARRVRIHHQDMRKLSLAERPFDAAVCLFDSIGYVATNAALEQVFRGVFGHLRPDGLFLFEFWHAPAVLRYYDPLRVKRWKQPEAEIIRISQTQLDFLTQLAYVDYQIYELGRDGKFQQFTERQTNRYFLMQEMHYWMTSTGFTPLKWFNGFQKDENITEETFHVLAVCRRNS
jgi:SAM-dependent methyltransferase